jgi:hypothetical protein
MEPQKINICEKCKEPIDEKVYCYNDDCMTSTDDLELFKVGNFYFCDTCCNIMAFYMAKYGSNKII